MFRVDLRHEAVPVVPLRCEDELPVHFLAEEVVEVQLRDRAVPVGPVVELDASAEREGGLYFSC